MPTCLPIVLRHCHRCASGRFGANGKFRVHANHELLDAWPVTVTLCTGCGNTTKLDVPERTHVRSVQPELLNLMHDNDPGPVAEPFQAPVVRLGNVGGSGRTERPAWQSPYGPPPHRAHRGRWAPVPVSARARPALRRGCLRGRCD